MLDTQLVICSTSTTEFEQNMHRQPECRLPKELYKHIKLC